MTSNKQATVRWPRLIRVRERAWMDPFGICYLDDTLSKIEQQIR